MLAIFTKIKLYAAALGAVLLAVLGALAVGFRKGEKSADSANAASAAKATNDAIAKTNAASQRVDTLPPDQVQQELQSKWSRD